MKAIYQITFLLALTGFFACKKVENKVFFEGGTAPVISATKTTVSLEPGSEGDEAITFKWTNPEYKFTTGISSHDVNYTLEIDTVGGNFSSGAKFSTVVSKELSITYTVGQLNAILGNTMLLQLDPRRDYNLEVRVISSIGDAVKITSSNKVAFKTRPFPPPPKVATPVNEELWLVGGATQGGWSNPLGDPYITTQKFTRVSRTRYELVTTLNAGDGYLALPVMGSWATKYCLNDGVDRGSTVDGGEFVYKGGGGQDFLSPATSGTYKLTFDFQLGRFTVVKQ
ncbi:MAG: SusE domain-containing protein [Chitinophagaceae bacterium]